MNIIHYSIRSFLTNEYYSIIRFASKQLFVATLTHWTLASCLRSPRNSWERSSVTSSAATWRTRTCWRSATSSSAARTRRRTPTLTTTTRRASRPCRYCVNANKETLWLKIYLISYSSYNTGVKCNRKGWDRSQWNWLPSFKLGVHG